MARQGEQLHGGERTLRTLRSEPAPRAGSASSIPAPYRLAAGIALAVGADVALDPAHNHVPLCPLRAVTGLWCPLCGGLRSVYALVHLDPVAALRDNAVLVFALPFAIVYWIDWVRRERAGCPRREVPRVIVIAAIVAALAFTVVRNIPSFDLLRGG